MKKLLPVVAGLTVMGAVEAQAVGMYLTFEGYVTQRGGSATILTEQGITDGMDVSYVFYVDTGADGEYTLNNGATGTYTDTLSVNYFFADLISDPYLYTENGRFNDESNYPTQYLEFNYGSDDNQGWTKLSGSGSNDTVSLGEKYNNAEGGYGYPSSLTVGDLWTGTDRTFDSSGQSAYFSFDLTLTDISATNPLVTTPIPAAAWLFGTALAGLFGFKARRRSSAKALTA